MKNFKQRLNKALEDRQKQLDVIKHDSYHTALFSLKADRQHGGIKQFNIHLFTILFIMGWGTMIHVLPQYAVWIIASPLVTSILLYLLLLYYNSKWKKAEAVRRYERGNRYDKALRRAQDIAKNKKDESKDRA